MKKIILALVLSGFFIGCSNDADQQEADVTLANKQRTGSSANDFLADGIFQELVIEIIYVENLRPSQTAIDEFVDFINSIANKPLGITVLEREIASPGNSPYTIEEILAVEEANRTQFNTATTIAMSILFLDGRSDRDEGSSVILGTAYRNTSMVIFESTIIAFSNGLGQPNREVLETAVLNHEFGHLLGLVNLGSPMQQDHQDEANGNHCDVESCLMNFQIETGNGAASMIPGGMVPVLDSQCRADLRANGGK